jgi:hypothetical protein
LPVPSKPFTFVNGAGNLIDATQVNADFDALYNALNPAASGLDKTNMNVAFAKDNVEPAFSPAVAATSSNAGSTGRSAPLPVVARGRVLSASADACGWCRWRARGGDVAINAPAATTRSPGAQGDFAAPASGMSIRADR